MLGCSTGIDQEIVGHVALLPLALIYHFAARSQVLESDDLYCLKGFVPSQVPVTEADQYFSDRQQTFHFHNMFRPPCDPILTVFKTYL